MSYIRKIEANAGTGTDFPGGIAEGANLRTPCGLRRIEMVRPGDLVVTRDNGLQPVRRVWERTVNVADILSDSQSAPICLLPRALGPMLPQARVLVAPDQRVLVPGYRLTGQGTHKACLIEARELASSCEMAFADVAGTTVRYFTIVFDNHQVICANGLPVESFLANASGALLLATGLRADLLQLFPHLKRQPYAYARVKYPVVSGARYLPDRV